MIVLDTSVLVDALTGPGQALTEFRRLIERRVRLVVPTLVLYEFLRGERSMLELDDLNELVPGNSVVSFTTEEAAVAARLFREVSRPRPRQVDLGIAAHAVVLGASLWTLNRRDFADLPGLQLHGS